MARGKLRPRHISTIPVDEPISTSLAGMDLEKRRLIFPPNFIDRIVLKGGDEYVKAEDLKTLINAVVEALRIETQQIILHLASMTEENISDRDVSKK